MGDADGCCNGEVICDITGPVTPLQLSSGEVIYQNVERCISLNVKFTCVGLPK